MRTHQRYFAMEDADGKLAQPVRDDDGDDRQGSGGRRARQRDGDRVAAVRREVLLRRGSQEVVRRSGTRSSTSVVFQAKLGDKAKTIGHKIRRIEAIVDALAERVTLRSRRRARARYLRKADLASHAVGEFPELQGVMGKHYARARRLRPTGRRRDRASTGGPRGRAPRCRRRTRRALVAIADRMDTIVGCFAVGLEPIGLGRSVRAAPRGDRHLADPARSRPGGAGRCRHGCRSHATRSRSRSPRQGVHARTDAARAPLDEFFRARLRGILDRPRASPRRTSTPRSRRTSDDPCDARLRARASRRRSARKRARCSSAIANILDDARGQEARDLARGRSGAVRRGDRSRRDLHDAITERAGVELQRARERDLPRVFESLERAAARRSPRSSTRAASWSWIPIPCCATTGSRCSSWFIAPYCAIADFRLLGRCRVKYVRQFGGGSAEGRAKDKALLGGKGANLAEMASLGLPVPPGFTITTEVCRHVMEHGAGHYPDELDGEVAEALAQGRGADQDDVRRREPAAAASACAPARPRRCPA